MSIAEPLSLCHLVGWAVPATRSPVNQESQPQCFCLKVLQLKKNSKKNPKPKQTSKTQNPQKLWNHLQGSC